MSWWNARKPSVFEQRQRAGREGQRLEKRLAKSGRAPSPVTIEEEKIDALIEAKAGLARDLLD